MAKSDNTQEIIQKTTDGISNDTERVLQDLAKEISENLERTSQKVFNQNQQIYLDKIKRIVEVITKTIPLIDEVIINYSNTNGSNNVKALVIMNNYLQIASNFNYISKIIDSLTSSYITIDSIQKIDVNFNAYIEDNRFTVSQGLIQDLQQNELDQTMFTLEEHNQEMVLYISRFEASYKQYVQQNDLDETISNHYEQFKTFTRKHYFSAQLGGREFYHILRYVEPKQTRVGFWKWYKAKKQAIVGEKGHYSAGFEDLLTEMATNEVISDTLKKVLLESKNIANLFSGKAAYLNYGHVAEAFERHLEEHHAFTDTGYPEGNSFPPITGYPEDEHGGFNDWIDHLAQSLGNLPGYLGPDTKYAQVKQYLRQTSARSDQRLSIEKKLFMSAREKLSEILHKIMNMQSLVGMKKKLDKQFSVSDPQIKAFAKDMAQRATWG